MGHSLGPSWLLPLVRTQLLHTSPSEPDFVGHKALVTLCYPASRLLHIWDGSHILRVSLSPSAVTELEEDEDSMQITLRTLRGHPIALSGVTLIPDYYTSPPTIVATARHVTPFSQLMQVPHICPPFVESDPAVAAHLARGADAFFAEMRAPAPQGALHPTPLPLCTPPRGLCDDLGTFSRDVGGAADPKQDLAPKFEAVAPSGRAQRSPFGLASDGSSQRPLTLEGLGEDDVGEAGDDVGEAGDDVGEAGDGELMRAATEFEQSKAGKARLDGALRAQASAGVASVGSAGREIGGSLDLGPSLHAHGDGRIVQGATGTTYATSAPRLPKVYSEAQPSPETPPLAPGLAVMGVSNDSALRAAGGAGKRDTRETREDEAVREKRDACGREPSASAEPQPESEKESPRKSQRASPRKSQRESQKDSLRESRCEPQRPSKTESPRKWFLGIGSQKESDASLLCSPGQLGASRQRRVSNVRDLQTQGDDFGNDSGDCGSLHAAFLDFDDSPQTHRDGSNEDKDHAQGRGGGFDTEFPRSPMACSDAAPDEQQNGSVLDGEFVSRTRQLDKGYRTPPNLRTQTGSGRENGSRSRPRVNVETQSFKSDDEVEILSPGPGFFSGKKPVPLTQFCRPKDLNNKQSDAERVRYAGGAGQPLESGDSGFDSEPLSPGHPAPAPLQTQPDYDPVDPDIDDEDMLDYSSSEEDNGGNGGNDGVKSPSHREILGGEGQETKENEPAQCLLTQEQRTPEDEKSKDDAGDSALLSQQQTPSQPDVVVKIEEAGSIAETPSRSSPGESHRILSHNGVSGPSSAVPESFREANGISRPSFAESSVAGSERKALDPGPDRTQRSSVSPAQPATEALQAFLPLGHLGGSGTKRKADEVERTGEVTEAADGDPQPDGSSVQGGVSPPSKRVCLEVPESIDDAAADNSSPDARFGREVTSVATPNSPRSCEASPRARDASKPLHEPEGNPARPIAASKDKEVTVKTTEDKPVVVDQTAPDAMEDVANVETTTEDQVAVNPSDRNVDENADDHGISTETDEDTRKGTQAVDPAEALETPRTAAKSVRRRFARLLNRLDALHTVGREDPWRAYLSYTHVMDSAPMDTPKVRAFVSRRGEGSPAANSPQRSAPRAPGGPRDAKGGAGGEGDASAKGGGGGAVAKGGAGDAAASGREGDASAKDKAKKEESPRARGRPRLSLGTGESRLKRRGRWRPKRATEREMW